MNLLRKEELKFRSLGYGLKFLLAVPTSIAFGPVIATGIFVLREITNWGLRKPDEENKRSIKLQLDLGDTKVRFLPLPDEEPVSQALETICRDMKTEKPVLFVTPGSYTLIMPFYYMQLGSHIVERGEKYYKPVIAHEMQHQKIYSEGLKARNSRHYTGIFNAVATGTTVAAIGTDLVLGQTDDIGRAGATLLALGVTQILSKIFHRAMIRQTEYVCDIAGAAVTGKGMGLAQLFSGRPEDEIRKADSGSEYNFITGKNNLRYLDLNQKVVGLGLRLTSTVCGERNSRRLFCDLHDLFKYDHPMDHKRIRKLIQFEAEQAGLTRRA